MYTCNHCNKKLKNVPYMCSNNKKYCSFECVPDSTIDKPYSFQYFNLMDRIRAPEIITDQDILFLVGYLMKPVNFGMKVLLILNIA
ncbi:hypothetical protein G9F72_004875 [Clostridium estertheticum]|uniref:hypothetical protein n=1 Tax=Clostridium estertheticum TaxID=238834 RepID=UPI0013E93898|nr:hypothetical protein [Clostridium estertheticum]MBZ9685685.1 hypothetical protein [Clostridium estertheticum]